LVPKRREVAMPASMEATRGELRSFSVGLAISVVQPWPWAIRVYES